MAARSDVDDLRAAWRALAGGREGDGWKTIPINVEAPCKLLAGRHLPSDEEAMLIGFKSSFAVPDAHLPQGHGFEVSRLRSDPTGGNHSWLALSLRPGRNLDLFAMMAEDLIHLLENRAHDHEEVVLRQFLERIRTWQDFMDRHQEALLSPEAELGLFGEIAVLDSILSAGVPARNALDAWQGPLDGLHDFAFGTGAVEVKTTLSTPGLSFTVTSLDQLDERLCQPLFLAGVKLSLDTSGITLPQFAKTVRERLFSEASVLGMFDMRLMQVGLLDAVEEKYTRRFHLVSISFFSVLDDFPRLTRANVHAAIRKAKYDVEIDTARSESIGLEYALERLGAI